MERWSEELAENGAVNVFHKVVSPIAKIFIGSTLCHEFILFRSLRFYVCVEFVNDHRVKMRVGRTEDFMMIWEEKILM